LGANACNLNSAAGLLGEDRGESSPPSARAPEGEGQASAEKFAGRKGVGFLLKRWLP